MMYVPTLVCAAWAAVIAAHPTPAVAAGGVAVVILAYAVAEWARP